jgi:hypothetical protein
MDYIKLNVSNALNREILLNDARFNWMETRNKETNEIEYPIKGKLDKCFDIVVNPQRIELSGSIHKLFNNLHTGTPQNYDDFECYKLLFIISYLEQNLKMDTSKAWIENLEIGINIKTAWNPSQVINNNLICHIKHSYNIHDQSFSGKGKQMSISTTQKDFKLYDKGRESKINQNIFRIEVKHKRNESLKKHGIKYLSCLKDTSKIKKALQTEINELIDNLIFVDVLEPLKNFEPEQRELFINGINPKHWNSLTGKKKQRFKDKFLKLLSDYNLDTIKTDLKEIANIKVNELFEMSEIKKSIPDDKGTCHKRNDFEPVPLVRPQMFEHFQRIKNPEHLTSTKYKGTCHKLNDFERVCPARMSQIEHYVYVQNMTSSKKCIISGIDISTQKKHSKFVSAKTLREIYNTAPARYKEILNKYGFDLRNETKQKQFHEISHRIRTRQSDYKKRYRKAKPKYQYSLFPLT